MKTRGPRVVKMGQVFLELVKQLFCVYAPFWPQFYLTLSFWCDFRIVEMPSCNRKKIVKRAAAVTIPEQIIRSTMTDPVGNLIMDPWGLFRNLLLMIFNLIFSFSWPIFWLFWRFQTSVRKRCLDNFRS